MLNLIAISYQQLKPMGRFLYEKSVSYLGYLIIPFALTQVDGQPIYSYVLLSEIGYRGKWHKAENPADRCACAIENLIDIAKNHLGEHSDIHNTDDYFKIRYTYHHNLIIVHQETGKCFYDHYASDSLNNIAAPKLFQSQFECIKWVKQGLDRNTSALDFKTLKEI